MEVSEFWKQKAEQAFAKKQSTLFQRLFWSDWDAKTWFNFNKQIILYRNIPNHSEMV